MGNGKSKENKNLEDFITENENNKKIDKIYNTTDQGLTNYDPETLSKDIKTEEKKLNHLKVPFYIKEDFEIFTIEEKKSYRLKIPIISKINANLFYYFKAEWKENEIFNKPLVIDSSILSKKYQINEGENFIEIIIEDVKLIFDDIYPLLISIHNQENDLISYNCFNLKLIWNFFKVNIFKRFFFIKGKYIQLTSIYGLSESKLNIEKEEKEACLICLTNDRDTMIKPCNHLILCSECSQVLKENSSKCPKCRGDIKSFLILKNK